MASETSDQTSTVIDRHFGGISTSLLVVLGAALFLIPEPITSILGALVLLVAISRWVLGRIGS